VTIQTATLDPAEGTASIEALVGQRQRGSFYIRLYNPNTRTGKVVGEGFSWDDKPDVFNIPDGGDLHSINGCILYWDFQITSSSPKPGEFYAATAIIRQNHKSVSGGVWQKAGELTGTVPVTDGVLLSVASAGAAATAPGGSPAPLAALGSRTVG
jgi:hypothetical protein